MKRIVLADAPVGAVMRVDGEWGVICRSRGYHRFRWRIVDFWWQGREFVPDITIVELA